MLMIITNVVTPGLSSSTMQQNTSIPSALATEGTAAANMTRLEPERVVKPRICDKPMQRTVYPLHQPELHGSVVADPETTIGNASRRITSTMPTLPPSCC